MFALVFHVQMCALFFVVFAFHIYIFRARCLHFNWLLCLNSFFNCIAQTSMWKKSVLMLIEWRKPSCARHISTLELSVIFSRSRQNGAFIFRQTARRVCTQKWHENEWKNGFVVFGHRLTIVPCRPTLRVRLKRVKRRPRYIIAKLFTLVWFPIVRVCKYAALWPPSRLHLRFHILNTHELTAGARFTPPCMTCSQALFRRI